MRTPYRLRIVLSAWLQISLFLGVTPIALKSAQAPPQLASDSSKRSVGVAKLWRDPGPVEKLDLAGGPGTAAGAPRPPFTFVEERKTGTSPKVVVTDSRNETWVAKFGSEVNAEVFATRIAWALGYFVDTTYFVPKGKINGAKRLGRAGKFVEADGSFVNACFELHDKKATFLKKSGWTWQNSPFIGTRELNGLKIVLMLTSNWDNKDARNESSNTGILEFTENGQKEWRYLITDWGGSMGQWGRIFTREKWDCEGFTKQTEDFVKLKDGKIKWGYTGKHTSDAKEDITLSDLKWLLSYLTRLTGGQITMALEASGATPTEVQCFAKAIHNRIDQMRRLAAGQGLTSTQVSPSSTAAAQR